MSPVAALIWCIAAWLGLRAAVSLVLLAPVEPPFLAPALTSVSVVVLGGGALVQQRLRGPSRALESKVPLRGRWIIAAAAVGAGLQPGAELASRAVERAFPLAPEVLAARSELFVAEDLLSWVMLGVAVGVVGPIAEELFYRGPLFTRLEQGSGALVAGGVTASAFVLGHPEPRQWAALTMVTVVLTWLRIRGRSLAGPVAMHVAFNTTALALGGLDLDFGAPSVAALGLGFGGTGLALALLSWMRRTSSA